MSASPAWQYATETQFNKFHNFKIKRCYELLPISKGQYRLRHQTRNWLENDQSHVSRPDCNL